MSDYLSLRFPRHVGPVAQAEAEAHRMMDAAGVRLFWGATDEDWIAAFGDTESELKEQASALARRYRSIPFWRRRERGAVLRHYISVQAMLTAAHGLETVWQ